ncbi:MAG: HAMP domain-containing histidine kinase [Eubacterium sp.]|nr:HAMP domain-containing histidine kinase [Eubacterium sp.]
MIHSLRIRFIRIAVLAVALVLFLIIGSINLLNYRNVAREADTILEILQENGGRFPQDRPLSDMPVPDTDTDHAEPDAKFGRHNHAGSFRFDPDRALSAETPFESRYFSVTLDETGMICSYDISSIAAVEESDLEELVQTVSDARKQKGFWNQYRYVQYESDGLTTLLFLDCSRSLLNARSFLLASILVSLLGLAGVLLLIVLFSGRVVRPVQESYEKQKRFITDAGHELKTPLTIIDADVSVAEMESGPSEWLDDIKSQTRRLAGLTGDLIYLSRMDEGAMDMQRIDFPVSEVINDTVQSFRARVQLEEKTLTADIEPLLSLYGDEKSITKLVTILLDNAVKYAKEKGTISVSLHKKSKNLEFIVQNDAESVDPASLPHFFDRFYRADASRNSSRGGYGIGLSMAQAIVTAHKGKITASLPEENLLRITVTLPVS